MELITIELTDSQITNLVKRAKELKYTKKELLNIIISDVLDCDNW